MSILVGWICIKGSPWFSGRNQGWSATLLSDCDRNWPRQKPFDVEGEALGHALTKSFRLRNDAMKSLCASVRRFRDATIKENCKRDYPLSRRCGKLWIARRNPIQNLGAVTPSPKPHTEWIPYFSAMV